MRAPQIKKRISLKKGLKTKFLNLKNYLTYNTSLIFNMVSLTATDAYTSKLKKYRHKYYAFIFSKYWKRQRLNQVSIKKRVSLKPEHITKHKESKLFPPSLKEYYNRLYRKKHLEEATVENKNHFVDLLIRLDGGRSKLVKQFRKLSKQSPSSVATKLPLILKQYFSREDTANFLRNYIAM
jgi:translation initiation factor 2 beta subunit (eIF-2beta)/eIF-5